MSSSDAMLNRQTAPRAARSTNCKRFKQYRFESDLLRRTQVPTTASDDRDNDSRCSHVLQKMLLEAGLTDWKMGQIKDAWRHWLAGLSVIRRGVLQENSSRR